MALLRVQVGFVTGAAVVFALAAILPASAGDLSTAPPVWRQVDDLTPANEAWSGGIVSGGIASVWYGYGYAPRSLLEPNDWRFRSVAGVTTYRDRRKILDLLEEYPDDRKVAWFLSRLNALGGLDKIDVKTFVKIPTVTAFADLLAGYQWRVGPLTAKVFGGVTTTRKTYVNQRYDTLTVETAVGGKAVSEFWLNIGPYAFAKLDAWAASAGPLGAVDVKVGAAVLPYLLIGPEARLFRYDSSRQDMSFGGFARLAWPTGEVTGSAGVMQYDDRVRGAGLYLGLSYLGRY